MQSWGTETESLLRSGSKSLEREGRTEQELCTAHGQTTLLLHSGSPPRVFHSEAAVTQAWRASSPQDSPAMVAKVKADLSPTPYLELPC